MIHPFDSFYKYNAATELSNAYTEICMFINIRLKIIGYFLFIIYIVMTTIIGIKVNFYFSYTKGK